MSNEQQQISFTLPTGGFRRTLMFNRFWFERVSDMGVLTSFDFQYPRIFRSESNIAFIVSNLAVKQSSERLAKYLHALGLTNASTKTFGELSIPSGSVEPVDYINCSRIDDMGEITFYSFNFHAAVKRPATGTAKVDLIADPIAKMRSSLEAHALWIQEFLKINAAN